jgi:hypothetical protein
MFSWGSGMHKALSNNEFKHSPFKNVQGSCGSSYIICDLLKKEDVTMAGLKFTRDWRILKPNEGYYAAYDQKGEIWEEDDIDNEDD